MSEPGTEPRVFANRFADAVGPSEGRPDRDRCRCVGYSDATRPASVRFHTDRQDTDSSGWRRLLDLIDQAATDGSTVFKPFVELSAAERRQIITLPPTIAKLTQVKHLVLYGTNLVRLPPEIGAMASLERFEPYTSHRLHWYPYELTRIGAPPGLDLSGRGHRCASSARERPLSGMSGDIAFTCA